MLYGPLLPQVEVLFRSEGRSDFEIDRRITDSFSSIPCYTFSVLVRCGEERAYRDTPGG